MPANRLVLLDRLTTSNNNLGWKLDDAYGRAILAQTSNLNDQGPLALVGGTYTLTVVSRIFGGDGQTGAYSFQVVDQGASTYTPAGDPLAIGSEVNDGVATPGGEDRYVFGAAAGQRVYLDLLTATTSLEWELIDPAGQRVFRKTATSVDLADAGPYTLAAGTYTLILDATGTATPSYHFKIWDVVDTTTPVNLDQVYAGSFTGAAGATHSFTFSVVEGQTVYLDRLTSSSRSQWTLTDPAAQPVFTLADADPVDGGDKGPFKVAAGTYTIVFDPEFGYEPTYDFRVWDVADSTAALRLNVPTDGSIVDAGAVARYTFSVPDGTRVFCDIGAGVNPLDWSLFDSAGTPLFLLQNATSASTDQGPFVLAGGIYTVVFDATFGNAAAFRFTVRDLDAGFAVETVFVDFTTSPTSLTVDFALAQPVTLDDVRFVLVEALTMELRRTSGTATTNIRLRLLSGGEEVIEVATASASSSLGSDFIRRFAGTILPDLTPESPTIVVDAIRFVFEQPTTTTTTIGSIHTDGRLRCHFAPCGFEPCGPHRQRTLADLPGIDHVGDGSSDWQVVMFPTPVPGDDLKLVDGPALGATLTHSIFDNARGTSEAELLIDDGSVVALSDWQPSSNQTAPSGVGTLVADHSLALSGGELDGRLILGFRWRVRVAGCTTGSCTASYVFPNPLTMSFLHDVQACTGAIPVAPVELAPPDGTVFPTGSDLTLSGRALSPDASRPISAVLVNGDPVDSIDAAGRFFERVTLADGENLFAVRVVEAVCGETQAVLRLTGAVPGEIGLEEYSDVTAQLEVEYGTTTFNRSTSTLIVTARARNVSDRPIDGPILMVIGPQLDPHVRVRSASGVTPQGEPYVVMLETGTLQAGQAGSYVTLLFDDPDRRPVIYDVRWLVPTNHAPRFTSAPAVVARTGAAYAYAASAVDPDGHPVTYDLALAPVGMTIDGSTGLVAWSPQPADAGLHEVAVAASDNRGARTEQRFTLSVVDAATNRPPVFTTSPVTHASVGAAYSYDADAIDLDGDGVTFALSTGPPGLTMDGAGRLAWGYALPGEHPISITASDGFGGLAVQSFSLTVGSLPSNPSAPLITGVPSPTAVVDIVYIYQPIASDPDGDILAYSLTEKPSGMTIDAATGRIEWTPAPAQVGLQGVTLLVADGRGGSSRQEFDINVLAQASNLPPIIESVPSGFARVGQLFQYAIAALDPEHQAVTYSLRSGPIGVMVDPTTGLLTWTPGPGDAGIRTLAVQAADPLGAAGQQAFRVNVRLSNAGPEIGSSPRPAAVAGQTYQYDVNATDDDGDVLSYSLVSGPAGMTIDPIFGLISWPTTAASVGAHPVTVRASDCCGGNDEQPFTVTITPDVTPPIVLIVFSEQPAPVGTPIDITVSAGDDVGIASLALTVECPPAPVQPLALDALGRTTFESASPAFCTFRATAVDRSGLVKVETVTLQVGEPMDPDDPYPPVVDLVSPAPESRITGPVPIVATITDATVSGPGSSVTWIVQIARMGTDAFTIIGSGSGRIQAVTVATLDPTLLPNDAYRIQIVGNDGGQTGGIEFRLNVSGDFKLGRYSTAFLDLTVPVAGIPLAVTRQYDSLDTSTGDFGAGWRLGLPGRATDNAAETTTYSEEFLNLLTSEAYTVGTRVVVTRPDGRRVGFTFAPRQQPFPGTFIFKPAFEADDGVKDTLEARFLGVDQDSLGLFNFGGRFVAFAIPYNPREFVFKTKEGVSYTIDEFDGLKSIVDLDGNTITVTPGGLVSSTGVSLTFVRDSAGRITRIIEPDDPIDPDPPGELEYVYDASGNLRIFRDQMDRETEYLYENPAFPHYLTRIEDPLDRPVIRNVFGPDGRLIGMCDANGDVATLDGCTRFTLDPAAAFQTIFNARGFRTDYILDARGNVRFEKRYLDSPPDLGNFLQTERVYDVDDNTIATTDPLNQTYTFTYDGAGNRTSRTDPGGRTWRTTWNDCNKAETEVDPQGNTRTYEYDDDCKLRFIRDPLEGVTEIRYNTYGQPTDLLDAEGSRWQFLYDAAALPSGFIDPLGRMASQHFNAARELAYQIDRSGRRIDFEYDDAHRAVEERWDNGAVTTYTYNPAGQIASAVGPDASVHAEYWNTGLVKSVDNFGTPGVPATVLTYGYLDAGSVLQPGYDASGNVTHVTDSLGGLTRYEYDALERLVRIEQSAEMLRGKLGAGDADGAGVVGDVAGEAGASSRDGAGSEREPSGADTSGIADAGDDLSRSGTPNVHYGEGVGSVGGRIPIGTAADRPSLFPMVPDLVPTTVETKRVDLVYDAASLLRTLMRFSDLAGTQSAGSTTYDYDCGGCPLRLSGLHHRRGDNTLVHDMGFVRDPVGNITQMTDAEGLHAYAYDGLRRLTSVDNPSGGTQPDESYVYDAVGNRLSSHLSSAYQYSYMLALGGNQLRQDDDFDYQYDDNGNQTRRTSRTTGDYTLYAYDHRNRITSIARHASDDSLLGSLTFTYDPLNRRIRAVEDGTPVYWVYDGRNPILKLGASSTVLSRRLYNRFMDGVLAEEAGGQTRWVLHDQVGTVRDLLANDGSVVNHYVYDAFGRMLSESSPGVENDLLWNGREFHEAFGIGFYRARYYDPGTGRFVGEDPLVQHDYTFAGNRPVSTIDPDGQSALIEYACKVYDVYKTFEPLIKYKESAAYKFWMAMAEALAHPEAVTDADVKEIHRLLYEYLKEEIERPLTLPDDPIEVFCGVRESLSDA